MYKDFNLIFNTPKKDTSVICDVFAACQSGSIGEELATLKEEHQKHLKMPMFWTI